MYLQGFTNFGTLCVYIPVYTASQKKIRTLDVSSLLWHM